MCPGPKLFSGNSHFSFPLYYYTFSLLGKQQQKDSGRLTGANFLSEFYIFLYSLAIFDQKIILNLIELAWFYIVHKFHQIRYLSLQLWQKEKIAPVSLRTRYSLYSMHAS